MTRYALILTSLALTLACGSPPVGRDASTAATDGMVSREDAVAVCARDSDCDDGVFCNGHERCRPGEGDARGCVAGDPPCLAECDEESQRCATCTEEEADRDGDGDESVVCGGNDCDDTDPVRYSGAIEICDGLSVDEDCDISTLHNADAAAAPGDRDGDGYIDVACANITTDGVNRGTDCDDGDGAIHPDAPERCNGVDDDCDDVLDEGFDCVQSSDVAGTNACGRSSSRRCSDSCDWLDDGYYLPESASTCDYCDDSGDGLGEELPFTETLEEDLCEGEPHGDAMAPAPGTCGGTYLNRVINTGASSGGAPDSGSFFLRNLELGYEAVTIDASVDTYGGTSTTRAGTWGIAVLTTVPSAFVGPPEHGGVPQNVDGFAAEWDVYRDGVVLRRLDASSSDPELARAEPADPPFATGVVTMSMTLVPDDPSTTATDETAVSVEVPCSTTIPACAFGGGTFTAECHNDGAGTGCGASLAPGDPLHIGLVAGVTEGVVTVDVERSPVSLGSVCR